MGESFFKWPARAKLRNREKTISIPTEVIEKGEKKNLPTFMLNPTLQNMPQWNDWDSEKAINEGFKSSSWVFSCIIRRMNSFASVPLVVETRSGSEWKAAPTHPLQQLLDNPNAAMGSTEYKRLLVAHLDLAGNFYSTKLRANKTGPVLELWPVMPFHMQAVSGAASLVSKYIFLPTRKDFPADDILHVKYIDPANLFYGQSPLMAAAKAVDVDNAAAAWQKIAMQNRAVPDGVFNIKAELSPEQFAQARQAVKESYAGMGNAREPWVVSNSDYFQLALTPLEMDYINTRGANKQEICAVYGVPSEMITNMGDANRASGENVRRVFWLDTMVPLTDGIVEFLNFDLVPDFGTRDKLRIRPDYKSVAALQENYGEKVTNAKNLWSMGVPFNALNKRLELGFDDIEGGDTGYLPAGLLPTNLDLAGLPSGDATLPTGDAARIAYGQDVPGAGDPGAAPPATESVQQAVLNGAQMASLQAIIQAVADGLLPGDSARALILVSVPGIDPATVDAMVKPAETLAASKPKEPEPDPNAPPVGNQPPAQEPPVDEEVEE